MAIANIRIEPGESVHSTKIFVNGEDVSRFVKALDIHAGVNNGLPTVTLHYHASLEIAGEMLSKVVIDGDG